MPRFRGHSHVALVWPYAVLAQRLQRYLVAGGIIYTRKPVAVSGVPRLLLSSAAECVCVMICLGHGSRASKSAGRENLAEEWAEDSTTGGRDRKACLATGPDCDVGSGVEEICFVAKRVDVGNPYDGGDGGSVYCQQLY